MSDDEVRIGDTVYSHRDDGKAPPNRLARLADIALEAIGASPDYHPGDRVFISVADDEQGGFGAAGYGDGTKEELDAAVIADLVEHIEAILTISHGHPVHLIMPQAHGHHHGQSPN